MTCFWFFKAFRSLFQRGGFWPSAGFAECTFGKMWTISNVTGNRAQGLKVKPNCLLLCLVGLAKGLLTAHSGDCASWFQKIAKTRSQLLVNHASRLFARFQSHQGIWLVVYGRLRMWKAPCWLPAAIMTLPWPLRLAWHSVGSFLLICESLWHFVRHVFRLLRLTLLLLFSASGTHSMFVLCFFYLHCLFSLYGTTLGALTHHPN